jgi:hypothetical protein
VICAGARAARLAGQGITLAKGRRAVGDGHSVGGATEIAEPLCRPQRGSDDQFDPAHETGGKPVMDFSFRESVSA